MTTVSVHEAKARLSHLLASVERDGRRVLICRYGRAVAELAPVRRGKRSRVAPSLRRIVFHRDPTEPTAAEWGNA
jgi:prevent-host-death family protein